MEAFWQQFLEVLNFILDHLMILNGLFAITIVFFQRKNPQNVWTWLLLLYFIPGLGFLFYLLIGTDMRKRKMFKTKEVEDKLNEVIRSQENQLKTKELESALPEIKDYSDLVMYNLDTMGSMISDANDLDIFTDGNAKFEQLLKDLEEAKDFIHIEYYIIKNDVVFDRIKDLLVRKAAEGVEVRILYDAMGCRFVRKKYWKTASVPFPVEN